MTTEIMVHATTVTLEVMVYAIIMIIIIQRQGVIQPGTITIRDQAQQETITATLLLPGLILQVIQEEQEAVVAHTVVAVEDPAVVEEEVNYKVYCFNICHYSL